MTREVLQQALAVLRGCLEHPDAADAIAAIEFELAQPVQPANQIHSCSYFCNLPVCTKAQRDELRDRFIASQPVQRPWVGLTDDEIKEIVGPYGDTPIRGYTRKLFDQIENKLKEKNA